MAQKHNKSTLPCHFVSYQNVTNICKLMPSIVVDPVFMELTNVQRSVKHMASTSFSCIVSADPITLVTWFKDGIPLLKSAKILIQVMVTADFTKQARVTINSTLTLLALTAKDSGQYWCKAQNTLVTKEMEAKYQLIVQNSSLFTIGKQYHECSTIHS